MNLKGAKKLRKLVNMALGDRGDNTYETINHPIVVKLEGNRSAIRFKTQRVHTADSWMFLYRKLKREVK